MSTIPARFGPLFVGNASALVSAARQLAAHFQLAAATRAVNTRLLRHYIAVGIVAPPVRRGRTAEYGHRHLLQLVAARRLVTEGLPLSKIAGYVSQAEAPVLERYLESRLPNSEAALLVAGEDGEEPRPPAPATPRVPSLSRAQALAQLEVLVDQQHDLLRQMHAEMRRMQHLVQHLKARPAPRRAQRGKAR